MRPTTPRPRTMSASFLLAVLVVGLLEFAPVLAAPVGPPARLPRSGSSVQQLEAEVEVAQGVRVEAEEALVDLLVRRIGLAAAATELSAVDRDLADPVEQDRRNARELAVVAYVGGSPSPLQFLLDADEAGDVAYRRGLVADRLVSTKVLEESARVELDGVRELVVDLADRRGRVETSLVVANRELMLANRLEQEARARLERAGRLAAVSSIPNVDPATGDPSPEAWAALRQCESRGNYGAVSPSGRYRGAYQFDVSTWLAVGGTGDPAAAAANEQDARALILFQRRGAGPWPVCGRFLLG